MPDNVNHPAHYETNGIECIDAMVASQGVDSVMSYCLCNAFKYIWRCQHKGNCREDIQKAIWYLNKWNELAVKRGFESGALLLNTTGVDVINAANDFAN